MPTCLPLLIAFVFLCCFVSSVNSQTVKNNSPVSQTSDAPTAVNRLREFYERRDYENGFETGRELVARFPESVEVQVWFIANAARNEIGHDALIAAQQLTEKHRENAWAWFALATAYNSLWKIKDAAPAAEKAFALAPDSEDFIFLYGASLLAQKKFEEVFALLDKNAARIKDQTRSLILKAETQYQQATDGKTDEARKKLAYETFAQAKESNPHSFAANYIYATYLNFDRRYAQALPLLKKAVALAPIVAHVRRHYWRALLRGQPAKSAVEIKTEIVADMNELLRSRSASVNALQAVSTFYGGELEMPDKQREFETALLKKFPQTLAAEQILLNKIRRFDTVGKDRKVDERKRLERAAMLKNFINRPKHFDESALGEAYANLFHEIKDDAQVPNAELLQLAENVAKFPQFGASRLYSMIAKTLSARKLFREAEKFINIGFEKTKAEIERELEYVKDEKQLVRGLDERNAVLQDALGAIYFKENRLDEAEKQFQTAIKLDAEFSSAYKNLGELYEAKNDFEKAENTYINAYSTHFGKENPHLETIKSLYRKRHQNLEGFEAYFEKVKETERPLRRARILAQKIAEPRTATDFNLKNLEAQPVSYAHLKGKIVVVNIWGTWCGPCVMEMPEFQQLHKKYAGDKDVAILTISNDEDLETIKKFMTDKKYDFAVLRDDNYLQSVGISIFPTTWFIDRTGKISFVKIGASDKLLEEFGWRIEELKRQNAVK